MMKDIYLIIYLTDSFRLCKVNNILDNIKTTLSIYS